MIDLNNTETNIHITFMMNITEMSERWILQKVSEERYGTGPLSVRKILLTADRGVSFEALEASIQSIKQNFGKDPTFKQNGREIACCFEKGQRSEFHGIALDVQLYYVYTPWRCEFVSCDYANGNCSGPAHNSSLTINVFFYSLLNGR
jgi:hypothetical protein